MKAAKDFTPAEINKLRADYRDLRAYATKLEQTVRAAVGKIDTVYNHRDFAAGLDRGEEVARIMNALEMDLDRLKHFGLGEPIEGLWNPSHD